MISFLPFDLVFRESDRLWFIPVSVVLLGVLFFLAHRATKNAFEENRLLRIHADDQGIPTGASFFRRWLGFSLLSALLIMAWAEPERRTVTEEHVYGGVRIAFLLDVSLSMIYAHDVDPFPNRLVAAKSVIAAFATQTVRDPELKGKYARAIIPFAGSALRYLPFTESYEEFIETIDAVDETVINSPGTSLLEPILEYELLLKGYPPKDDDTVDIMVLISDGGKGEGIASEMIEIKAALGRMPRLVTPFTVGVGSVKVEKLTDGSEIRKTIPVPLIIKDSTGGFVGYALEDKNDPKSKRLYSELDERILGVVAGSPDRYFFYEGKDRLLEKLKEVIVAKRKLSRTIIHERFSPIAYFFLLPAVIIAFVLFGYLSRFFALIVRPFQGVASVNKK